MLRSFCFVLLLFGLSNYLSGQQPYKTKSDKAIKNYENGLQSYQTRKYALAEVEFKEAIEIDSNFQNAYLVLAEVYWEQGKLKEAIEYYDIGLKIEPSFYPKGYLNKGGLEIKIGDYQSAGHSYQTFLALDTANNKYTLQAKQGLQQVAFALYQIKHPVNFTPINLGPAINTKNNEYWPTLSADENTLVITRMVDNYSTMGTVGFQEDFYYSKKSGEVWGTMKNAGSPLNTLDNEGAQSISADSRFMVYTVCNRQGVIGRCDIYCAEWESDNWSFPRNIGAPVNTTAKETQPSLSADGRTLYFSSDRAGGKGGLDIWKSVRKDDNTWSLPINLGDSVNTKGDEMSPFIHQDNVTLYYSSNEKLGMGGFDIFIARRDQQENWTMVKNIGYPINTQKDEVGLIVSASGTTAYYSSDIDEMNGKDIFQFDLYNEARPSEVSYLKGKVFDEKTRERLRAGFELYDLSDGKLLSKSYSDAATGEFLICIPTNKNYMLNVDKKGYLFYSDNFELKGVFHLDQPYIKDIPLKSITKGESIVLKNIFFETDDYSLKDESKYELDKVIRFLTTNPGIRVEISGHTDNIGSEEHNLKLSANRGKSVVDYLILKGIPPAQLTYKGYGYTMPINTNATVEGRAGNRRTELKIIE